MAFIYTSWITPTWGSNLRIRSMNARISESDIYMQISGSRMNFYGFLTLRQFGQNNGLPTIFATTDRDPQRSSVPMQLHGVDNTIQE